MQRVERKPEELAAEVQGAATDPLAWSGRPTLEGRLAEALARGRELRQAAQARGFTYGTARGGLETVLRRFRLCALCSVCALASRTCGKGHIIEIVR